MLFSNLDGEQDIDGADHVVGLCEHGPLPINHGVGGAALLSKVDDCIRVEVPEGLPKELPVTDVTNGQLNVLATDLTPPASAGCTRGPSCSCTEMLVTV
jgi:hypothetical protein